MDSIRNPGFERPALVVGLDSGCGNYEQLWSTTSLRGLVNGVLTVEVLTEGVHSGDASGVVASSFRIARTLLERIDDADTGVVKHAAFHAQVPPERAEQARRAAQVLGEEIWRKFPFVPNMQPMQADLADLVLNRTWRPFLAVTGADGLPPPASAGNVLRPKTELVLSLRLPPTVKADSAAQQLKAILEADPPYGARVTFQAGHAGTGWHAPQTSQMAIRGGRERFDEALWKAGDVDGRGRHHPVHGDARRQVPAGAVPDHRRARPALQRPRPERVPAHRLRQAPDRLRRRRIGRSRGKNLIRGQGHNSVFTYVKTNCGPDPELRLRFVALAPNYSGGGRTGAGPQKNSTTSVACTRGWPKVIQPRLRRVSSARSRNSSFSPSMVT